MVKDIDILVPEMPAQTKQHMVVLTSLKQVFQDVVPQGNSQCLASCPICRQEGKNGACNLEAGHKQNHQCNLNSSHHWAASTTDVPGAH